MPTLKEDRDDCPLDACDDDPTLVLVTTETTKLTTQNFVHERVCLAPTMHDGDPAVYITYHEEIDAVDPEPVEGDSEAGGPDDTVPEPDDLPNDPIDEDDLEDWDDDEDDLPDPGDLEGKEWAVFLRIVEATAVDGSIKLGTLKGQVMDADIPPGDVEGYAKSLIDADYVDEIDDAIYKARVGA